MYKNNIPLVVDLDGTLIKTDLLLENLYAAMRANPFIIFCVPFWLLRGKAYLKHCLYNQAKIDVTKIPYNQDFLQYLQEEHKSGRAIVLATASVKKYASQIASHLSIFSEVFATDENINLAGQHKRNFLLQKYGEKGFDYAGNARPDLHIFPHARKAVLVNASLFITAAARRSSKVDKVFSSKSDPRQWIKAARVYQWIKNILLFIPMVTSHQWSNMEALFNVCVGFLAFSLCASGGYVFNDLLDLSADRKHPRKKFRPFASGTISIWAGTLLMIALQVVGLSLGAMISAQFFWLLVLYLTISLSYTFYLKIYVLIDVLILASLYTLRIFAGGVLAGVPISFWLFAFAIFIFFSLALVKRCSELMTLASLNMQHAKGKDYNVSDISHLREMGIASGYLSILVFAFYINSADVAILYSHPKLLWLAVPVLFYWVSRIWLKTGRGEMTDDPIIFSVKDKGSRVVGLVILLIVIWAAF